jgi:transcription elongation GreA/GreB family factor
VNRSDKQNLLSAVIAQIDEELVAMTKIAKDAADAAAHPENRAEGNKDMRSTEASYIARGQAERAMEIERHKLRLSSLELKEFSEDAAVEATAIIETRNRGRRQVFFMLPVAGGRTVPFNGEVICTVTPTSPLGSALLGLEVGDEAEVAAPDKAKIYEIVSIF